MSNWPTNGNLTGKLSIGQGEPGKSLEYMWRGTELGIRVEGEEEYQFVNLASSGTGSSGREIELQVNNGYIQWRYVGEEPWNNLIELSALKGKQGLKGDKGEQGLTGATGPQGEKGEKGDTGATGPQGIQGITGEQGPKGDKGDRGEKGERGERGERGPQGLTGATGPQGIQGVAGKDGVTPDMSDFEDKINKQYEIIEKKIDDHIENHPQGGGSASIDDTVISTKTTWSSSKIEDFVLTNVGTVWKEINGGQMVIDSTMDGFLREVEILGNTTQKQEDLSDIQHLGVWNEEKQGYEIEIVVSNSSSKDDLNYQEFRTTIILPCQLMKVGNISDRLYWDKNKGRYVVEKRIKKYVANGNEFTVDLNTNADWKKENTFRYRTNTPLFNDYDPGTPSQGTINNLSTLSKAVSYWDVFSKDIEGIASTNVYNNQIFILSIAKSKITNSIKDYFKNNKTYIYYPSKPQLIDTDIREELKLPTFINNTYITVTGGIEGSIKAKAPVDGGKVIGVLQEENIKLKETNKEQDELINTTMLATDEMYSLLEPLFIDMLIDKDVSPLLNMYVAMVKRDLKTKEQVPEKYREKVEAIINESH